MQDAAQVSTINKEVKMEKIRLNYMLLGKTGEGKSATGNTLLGRRFNLNKLAFKVSSNSRSQTKEVNDGTVEFGQYILHVVDTPGVMDTDLSDAMDKETVAKMMDEAIAKCYDGVDAFLYVIKFGGRFTEEDRLALQALKAIFGDDFIKHVIVVMTCGDMFLEAMIEEDRDSSFEKWCREQTGPLRQLYDDCNGRFVLFNNREKNEQKRREQVDMIVELSQKLTTPHCRYTSDCFQAASFQREKLILENKAPQLKEVFQEKISLLTDDIDKLPRSPSENEKLKIRKGIKDLRDEIEKTNKGYDVLNDMLELVKQLEDNINDVDKLQALAPKLEKIRIAKTIIAGLGTIVEIIGGGVMKVKPTAGAITFGVSRGAGFVGYVMCNLCENKIVKEISDIQTNLKAAGIRNQRKN